MDVGTQGCKAILYDLRTHAIAGRGVGAYDLIPRTSTNCAEQDPSAWLEGIRAAVAQALASAGASPDDLASVGVSGKEEIRGSQGLGFRI